LRNETEKFQVELLREREEFVMKTRKLQAERTLLEKEKTEWMKTQQSVLKQKVRHRYKKQSKSKPSRKQAENK
jgi:tRNA G10  N-methylase Trm11